MLHSEIEKLKQKYFHERRKNQRLRKAQPITGETSGRRSSNSRKPSNTKPPSTSNEKLQVPSPISNEIPEISSSEEDDMRSRKCIIVYRHVVYMSYCSDLASATLLDEFTEEEHQRALNS